MSLRNEPGVVDIRTVGLTAGIDLAPVADAHPASGKTLSRIAFGSCAKQDKDQPIWEAIFAAKPDLFVFLGDMPAIPQAIFPALRLALAGGAFALLAGLGIAIGLGVKGRGEKVPPPPASQGGLVVETVNPDDGRMDPARPLRCFVAGQFVGEITLAECARKNGVATGSLDVGVDEAGNLAAADQAGTMLTPLPPVEVAPKPAPPAPVPISATRDFNPTGGN